MGLRTEAVPPPGRATAHRRQDTPGVGALPRATAEPPVNRKAGARGGSRFLDDYLGYLLGQANHALFKDFDDVVRETGLGSLEWRVLATLSEQQPMAVGCLAREVLSLQPTVTKLLQRLSAQGWVRLKDDTQDQRRRLVAITAAGQRKITPLIARAREHEAQTLAGLSAAEVTRLKDQLRRLASAA